MLFRRKAPGPRTIETREDANALAAELRERARKLGETPGLLDGSLEEMYGALERVLREHHRVTRGSMAVLGKDLETIARRVAELREERKLSPRQAKLVASAIQHARRVHFYNARKATEKLGRGLEPLRAWRRDLDTYRDFHRKAADRVREAEATLERLRSVPRPPEGPDDVARFRALIESCNRAADEAWALQTSRPSADAVAEIVAHPDFDGLGLLSTLEFACLRELSDGYEAQEALKGDMGGRSLAELVDASDYSVGKWERVFPNVPHERKRLQGLFTQLRPVVSGRYGASFDAHAGVKLLDRRVAAWRRFPGGNSDPMRDLVDLLVSGRVPAIQEAAGMYEEHGELAERAWDGRLGDDVQDAETELLAAKKELAALPDPDALAR